VTTPEVAFHETDLSAADPCTTPVNCAVPPFGEDAEVGEIVTSVTPELAAETIVTVAVADLLASASLVALTVAVPGIGGAVYSPAEEIVPIEALQVTALSSTAPCTKARNCNVSLVDSRPEAGEMVM